MQKILKPLVNKKTKYVPKGSGGFQPFPFMSTELLLGRFQFSLVQILQQRRLYSTYDEMEINYTST